MIYGRMEVITVNKHWRQWCAVLIPAPAIKYVVLNVEYSIYVFMRPSPHIVFLIFATN